MGLVLARAVRFGLCGLWLVLGQVALAEEVHAGNLIFQAPDPAVWTRTEANGAVLFTVAATGDQVALAVYPNEPAEADFRQQFDAAVRDDLDGAKVLSRQEPGLFTGRDGTPLLRAIVHAEDEQGASYRCYLAARPGDRFEWLVYEAPTAELFKQYAPAMNRLLASLRFANVPDTPRAMAGPPAPRLAPQQGPAALPAGGQRLDGLYRYEVTRLDGAALQRVAKHYYFRPNGQVYFGVPPGGLEAFDFDALARADRATVGYYAIAGGKLYLQRLGQPAEARELVQQPDGSLTIDGLPVHRVGQFSPDQRLQGRYVADGAALKQVRVLQLRTDGTCTITGSAEATGAAERPWVGQYHLAGNTLVLEGSDGTRQRVTAYPEPAGDEQPPSHLNLGGYRYALQP